MSPSLEATPFALEWHAVQPLKFAWLGRFFKGFLILSHGQAITILGAMDITPGHCFAHKRPSPSVDLTGGKDSWGNSLFCLQEGLSLGRFNYLVLKIGKEEAGCKEMAAQEIRSLIVWSERTDSTTTY